MNDPNQPRLDLDDEQVIDGTRGWVKDYRSRNDQFRDLLEEAVFKHLCRWAHRAPTRVSHGGKSFVLERGQIMVSTIWLADQFRVSRKVMRSILENLRARGGIIRGHGGGHVKGHGGRYVGTIITVCNYSLYQGPTCGAKDAEGHGEGQGQGTIRATEGPEYKKLRSKKERDSYVDSEEPTPNGTHLGPQTEIAVGQDDIDTAIDRWNQMAERQGLSVVRSRSAERRQKTRHRLKECGGLGGWEVALAKVAASDFLCGRRGSWRATFDAMTTKGKFTRLMEGAYDNQPGGGGDGGQPVDDRTRQRRAGLADAVGRRVAARSHPT